MRCAVERGSPVPLTTCSSVSRADRLSKASRISVTRSTIEAGSWSPFSRCPAPRLGGVDGAAEVRGVLAAVTDASDRSGGSSLSVAGPLDGRRSSTAQRVPTAPEPTKTRTRSRNLAGASDDTEEHREPSSAATTRSFPASRMLVALRSRRALERVRGGTSRRAPPPDHEPPSETRRAASGQRSRSSGRPPAEHVNRIWPHTRFSGVCQPATQPRPPRGQRLVRRRPAFRRC